MVCGAAAVVAALAFVLAPVRQPLVSYHWAPAPGAGAPVALPLMPYQPQQLTAAFGCDTLRRLGPSGVLLSTVPLHPDPSAPALPGLQVATPAGELQVSSDGTAIATTPVPASGGCSFTLRSDPQRTVLLRDGTPIATVTGDVRPAVSGLFTEARDPAGLDVRLVTDTRFQTTPTPLKLGLAAICGAALLGLLVGLWRADRRYARRPPALTGHQPGGIRRRRPRPVDAAVTAVLGAWWIIGPVTVDDGYIRGIVASRGANGFIGNVYRWLNAPEAPFSWFYEVDRWWVALAPGPFASVLWMRLPSMVLGLVCWLLLSRLVLPRLGRVAARRRTWWIAALMFIGWWLPFTPGLRPEPWVAVGVTAVLAATERAIVTRRVLLLAVAFGLAGATIAMTPAGLMAVAPLLAAIVPIFRMLRARADLHRWPLVLALTAPAVGAVLLMVPDQSAAAVVDAARVRVRIGGGLPWYEEFQRYDSLLTPTSFVGNLTLRGPVLLTVLALAGLAWALFDPAGGGRVPDVATRPARRLVGTVALSLAALTLSPTKWTYHFGGLAGPGAALLVLLVHAWSRSAIRSGAGRGPWSGHRAGGTLVAATAGLTAVGSLVFAGRDIWPFVSDAGIPWSTVRPHLGPIPLAELVLGAGSLLVAVLTVRLAWRRAAGRDGLGERWWRRVPTPGLLALLLIGTLVVVGLGSFARASMVERQRYTVAGDDLAAFSGASCGLADDLGVETDPLAGLLQPLDRQPPSPETAPPRPGGALPLMISAQALPGWQAPAGSTVGTGLTTGWYRLTAAQRGGSAPLVVTLAGPAAAPGEITAAFGHAEGAGVVSSGTVPVTDPGGDGTRDVRMLATPGADAVRLHLAASNAQVAVSVPRAPQTAPLSTVLPPGSTALLDWPVAFVFPCLRMPRLQDGTAGTPGWRIAPPVVDTSAQITYSPRFGGPFAGPATLVHPQRVPVYLRNDPTREVVDLYRWVPITAFTTLQPVVTQETVSGWHREGPLGVPGR